MLRNVKEMQKFLELANYYRQFIKDFVKLAVLLHILVKNKEKWRQERKQEEAFEKLKEEFMTEPVLAILDLDKEMQVEADTSDYAIEGVLSTKYENGKQRLVAFIFKSLNAMEQNYKIYDKEILVVIRCLEAQKHYLKEAKMEFKVWTDHKNLQYFMMSQKLNQKQVQWALYLLCFNFILKHIPGKSIDKANRLSQRAD